jgi:predicted histone-like DNA-binding protein
MALKYRLVTRKRKARGEEKNYTYAQQNKQSVTKLAKIVTLVEKISAVSSGDIKSVLDTLSEVVALELMDGNIVDLGDLGRFRFVARSIAAKEGGEKFSYENLRAPSVRFSPGRAIRQARANTVYELDNNPDPGKCPAQPGGTPTPNPGGTGGDPSSVPGQ